MKDEERLSIELVGDGPLRRVMITTTGLGQVRGYVARPATHLPSKRGKLDVAGAIGRGLLCVIRTQPWNKEPYRSIMEIVSGEIGQDIAHYLVTSEQISVGGRTRGLRQSRGRRRRGRRLLVQVLSGGDARVIDRIEGNVAALPSVTTLVREGWSARPGPRGGAGGPRRATGFRAGGAVQLSVHARARVRRVCSCSAAPSSRT